MTGVEFNMKQLLIFIALCNFVIVSTNAQKLNLNIYLGSKKFGFKLSNTPYTNVDPSFSKNVRTKNGQIGASLELKYPKHSYEIYYANLNSYVHYNTTHPLKASHIIYQDISISQFQLTYNKIFNIKSKMFQNFHPFLGCGLGIGINRKDHIYEDSSFTVGRWYITPDLLHYIDHRITDTGLAKVPLGIVFKAGFDIIVAKKRTIRLMATYNLGISKIFKTDINYSHDATAYYGSSVSKGNMLSLLATIPLTVKRWKK